jgi:hypothetical protein
MPSDVVCISIASCCLSLMVPERRICVVGPEATLSSTPQGVYMPPGRASPTGCLGFLGASCRARTYGGSRRRARVFRPWLYIQQVLGYSAIKTGVSYLPLALTIIFSAGIASQLVTRIGFKPVLMTGMALLAGGLVWFGQVSVGGSYVGDILGPSLLAAVGLGLAFVPVTMPPSQAFANAMPASPAA